MRAALFAAAVALAIVVVVLLVKKEDAKPTKSGAGASDGSARLADRAPSAASPDPSPALPSSDSGATQEAKPAPKVVPTETAVADAFAALTSGDAANALAIAEQVLAREPEHKGMTKVAAMAACALGKADVAQTYYEAAERSARANISSLCQSHGIHLRAASQHPSSRPDLKRAGTGS